MTCAENITFGPRMKHLNVDMHARCAALGRRACLPASREPRKPSLVRPRHEGPASTQVPRHPRWFCLDSPQQSGDGRAHAGGLPARLGHTAGKDLAKPAALPAATAGCASCWSWWACPTWATASPSSSAAGSGSASRSRARWPCSRACCSWTSRSARWTLRRVPPAQAPVGHHRHNAVGHNARAALDRRLCCTEQCSARERARLRCARCGASGDLAEPGLLVHFLSEFE